MTAEESITPGADVVGADGDKVGTVEYVVVNPDTMGVTDVVVSTGTFLGRDIVVGIDNLDRIADDKVYLRLDKKGLEACKDYVNVEFTAPPTDWAPTGGLSAYPSGIMLWPGGMYYPEASDVTVNAPPGTVGLHEGMTVQSSDGAKIGSIKSLEADPASETITEIVVKHGFISSHEFAIPADLVKSIDSDTVHLSLSEDEVNQRFAPAE